MEKTDDEKRRTQIAKRLGANLLKLRKEKGYTREELAEKSNLSSNYIYGLENGTYLPGCIALIDLANTLDVTVTKLLNDYMDNKKNTLLENIEKNINSLSDRDINLILNIIDFFNNNTSP